MEILKPFAHLDIDWETSPGEITQMYMEQEDNSLFSSFPALSEPQAPSYYFTVDTWEKPAAIKLMQRDQVYLKELASFPVPDKYAQAVQKHTKNERGIFQPPQEIIDWLKSLIKK